ncbi:MAG: sigma-54-dependent Fis family transcriptional regulator [Planctomycetaceae bacterium]|nr:sigma-54-dependent Fis family transcriptional regulator [Planctomycetaceae bacterium]
MAKVLIVDDEEFIRDSFGMTLERAGYNVLTAESGNEGLGTLAKHPDVACVVSDIKMPGMDGLELLAKIKDQHPTLPVIIISAHGTPEDAARAIKLGALDYFAKPFSAGEIEARIGKAIEHHNLAEEAATLREVVKQQAAPKVDFITASSGSMARLRETLERIAASDSTVLIQGESGTGKEVVARYIHTKSARADKPFLAVNCAALSAGLLESELFGHERGAFTGAERQRKGRFELARGGTLLLDEVSEIDVHLQAKLLRVLQEKNFERVGSSDTIKADVRVLATTNRDLNKAVREGKFREDLFFRLNVLPVVLPPLRERKGDIPDLARHFLTLHGRRMGREAPELDAEAAGALSGYGWPGNVRELENVLERVLVLENAKVLTGPIVRKYLGTEAPTATIKKEGGFILPGGEDDVPSIETIENKLIQFAMQRLGGDKNKVAEALGITTKTLRAKLKKLGVE